MRTSTLPTNFGRMSASWKQETPMTNDQLMRIAPSIFAEDKHESRSTRYTYIPTISVIEGLKKEGFMPFFACQGRSRIEGKTEFTKHLIRFRQVDQIIEKEANEIVLINSHDGTSSYQMMSGIYRLICSNGAVTSDIVDDIRIPHKGSIVDNVIEGAFRIVDSFEEVNYRLDTMKAIPISTREAEVFAKAALSLKYDKDSKEDEDNVVDVRGQWRESKAPVSPSQIITPKRFEDRGQDLWTRFNVVQENLIRGGQNGRSTNGRHTTTRPVNSIDNNVKLNKALWILADEMARLKAN